MLGLHATYERKRAAFGFLNLDNFTEDDVLRSLPFTCKQHNSFFFVAE
jgi:hypothetical protein